MANELQRLGYATTGLATVYAVLHTGLSVVKASDGSVLLTRNSTNWANAAITMSDSAAAGNYVASVPSAIASGRYTVCVYLKSGGSAALSDTMIGGPGVLDWDATTSSEIVGANVTHENFEAVVLDTDLSVDIASLLEQLSSGTIALSRVNVGGDLQIRVGDSYSIASGQTIPVSKPSGSQWPALDGTWTLTFTASKKPGNLNTGTAILGPITCVVTSTTAFRIDLTSVQTTGLATGAWVYEVQAVKSGEKNGLTAGALQVLPYVTVA